MDSTKRIIVNTIAQYAKAIVNIGLSLYSTRLILDALSISDYGIYAVVGGVVAMLGFITNGLVVTTQRYISFYHGRGEQSFVSKVFTNSLFLHIVFGLAIGMVLLILKGWLFGGVLNIPLQRIETAGNVYFVTIVMLFITIVTAPFKALFIARENIVYVSLVEVCDGIIKLLFAIALTYVTADRLMVYAFLMCSIQALNFLAFAAYGRIKFEECRIRIRRSDIAGDIIRQLMGFAGWTIYSMGTLAAKNQGMAIVINHFLGTLVNAAYGVAAQVDAAIMFVSSSIINAMNPQIMMAEGGGDRKRVLMLAGQESKYSTILLSIAAIPILSELPELLSVWLKEVPEKTVLFCSFALCTCLVDQMTIGLNTVNRAQGKIGLYTFIMFTPKLLCLPICWWLLNSGYSLESALWTILCVEVVTSAARIPFLKYTAGLSISTYLRDTILSVLPLICSLLLFSWGCTKLMHFPFRFLLSIPLSVVFGLVVAWTISLHHGERQYITNLLRSKLRR
jgi:O-antigen/teichoic acid export membrane protein